MIIDYPHTNTNHISSELNRLRCENGIVVLGHVLTLIIITQKGQEEDAIATAIAAGREHPSRIIVLAPASSDDTPTRMNAQIRLGSDSSAGEIIVIHGFGELRKPTESLVSALILPDVPVVVWWHTGCLPDSTSTTSLDSIAHRRITDVSRCVNTVESLKVLSKNYVKGDTDLAWTRTTRWRAQLVAALDQLQDPSTVHSIVVEGAVSSSSSLLLASWLKQKLAAPLTLVEKKSYVGIYRVTLNFAKGQVDMRRIDNKQVAISQPGRLPQHVSLSRRSSADCIAEELRHLDEDIIYGDVITQAFPQTLKTMTLEKQ